MSRFKSHLAGEPYASVVSVSDVKGRDPDVVADGRESVGGRVVEDEGEHPAELVSQGRGRTILCKKGKEDL